MTVNDLKSKLAREPFRPFIIELDSGRRITISADSELFFPRKRPGLVIAFTTDGLQHEFETSAIASLIDMKNEPKRLYELITPPAPKISLWKRICRFIAISSIALTGVIAVPLGKAIYWSTHNALYHAQQERAEYNRISSEALAKAAAQMSPHEWDANGTAYGKVGTIGHHMTEVEYQRRMAAHELTLADVNRHNRGE